MAASEPKDVSSDQPRLSWLAVVAFVLGLIPLGVTNVVAIPVAAFAVWRIWRSSGRVTGLAFALAGAIVAFDILAIGAVAWRGGSMAGAPTGRLNQEEAKAVLRSLYISQKSHFALFNKYAWTFGELNWHAPPWSLYTYYMGDDVMGPGVGKRYPLPANVEVPVRDTRFAAAAVANLDKDPTLDVWFADDSHTVKHVIDDTAN